MSWGTSAWGTGIWGADIDPGPPPPLPASDPFGPRLLSVKNSRDGILFVRFNEPMLQDEAILQAGNYQIFLGTGAKAFTITDILVNPSQTDLVTILFEGGGGTYDMEVSNLSDISGNMINPDFDSASFEITRPGGVVEPVVRLFDTVFGPMGLVQQTITERTIDKMVINRTIDVAMREQLDQRLQAMGAAIPLRSGKDGGRRR